MSEFKGSEIGEGLVPFFTNLMDVFDENRSRLTQWEESFMQDQKDRFEAHGADFRCSIKQWEIITRIGRKLGVTP